MSESWLKKRAQVAALAKHHPGGCPELDVARAELAEFAAEKYVRKLVAEAPALSPAQITRLRTLLSAGGDSG